MADLQVLQHFSGYGGGHTDNAGYGQNGSYSRNALGASSTIKTAATTKVERVKPEIGLLEERSGRPGSPRRRQEKAGDQHDQGRYQCGYEIGLVETHKPQ